MTIDIRGVNTHNKGAQLMMMAIVERLGADRSLSVSPNGSSYDVRAKLGLRQTMLISQVPRLSAAASNFAPASVRKAFGLSSDSDITGVLDASGFAYSDSFSAERSKRESVHARRWSAKGVPVVFLPQAFGPFTHSEQRRWSGEILRRGSIVFARDASSLQYVRELDPKINVELAPDFTIGLKPSHVSSPLAGEFMAIVPNNKMVSHAKIERARYVDVLVTAGQVGQSAGLRPIVVIHEHNDLGLGQQIAERLQCQIYSHEDPLVLKRVLGDARVAVASRFHAIVGALSQETPALAYGWSHKYGALLGDFGVPHWEMDPSTDVAGAVQALMADDAGRIAIRENAQRLQALNATMWAKVDSVLGRPAAQ